MLEHIERLKAWQALDLPSASSGWSQNRRKIAREGGQIDARRPGEVRAAAALRDPGGARHRGRVPSPAIVDLHDRILGKLEAMPPRTSLSAAVPGIRQRHDQCQGAAVRAHRPGR
jgi:hypothetical protein